MDGQRFDALAKGLTTAAPRRQIIASLVGGALAVMAAAPALAVKKRKRRGKAGGPGDDGVETVESMLPPGTLAGGIWDETIEICHFNAEKGIYEVVPISTPLVPDYLNAGDTLYIDCCTDAECGALPCLEPTSCVQGACAYDVVEGAACALEDGSTGTCDADARCVVIPTAPVVT